MTFEEFVRQIKEYESDTFSGSGSEITTDEARGMKIFKRFDPKDKAKAMDIGVWWPDDYFGIVVSCDVCGRSLPLRQYPIEANGTTRMACPNPKCKSEYQEIKLANFNRLR